MKKHLRSAAAAAVIASLAAMILLPAACTCAAVEAGPDPWFAVDHGLPRRQHPDPNLLP